LESADTVARTSAHTALDAVAVLRVTCARIGCAAAAIVLPGSNAQQIWAATPADESFAKTQLASLGQEIAQRVATAGTPIVTNKLKASPGAPVACRLVAVPLMPDGRKTTGTLLVLNRPEGAKFDDNTVRRAERFARLFCRAQERDRDKLTGLLAWSAFKSDAQRLINGAAGPKAYCMVYGDIDRMHVANDLRGYSAGDKVIAEVGNAIRGRVRAAGGLASRLSGDRFMMLLPEVSLEQAQKIVGKIGTDVAQLTVGDGVGEGQIDVSVSWGIAAGNGPSSKLEQVVAEAEIACKAAKDRGRGRAEIFQAGDLSIIRRHDDIVAIGRIRDALQQGRIEVYAQTVAPLINNSLPLAYELLVRLRDTNGAIMEPAQFMSAATRYQLLPDMDRAVVRKAFEQLKAFNARMNGETIRVSINLAGPTIGSAGFTDWIVATMNEYGIQGKDIVFEITEAAAAANLAQLQACMKQLSALGVRFALDDFGTGVNSLAYLKALDVSTIKLDGAYVRDIEKNARSEALVCAIVQLAHGMGITTIAEYVETVGIRKRLAELGVQFGQGFAIARPVPFEDVLEAIAGRGKEFLSLSA
jgi:diguanylate cyclase (GGDEF)-like protein